MVVREDSHIIVVSNKSTKPILVSIVVPVFNEGDVLRAFWSRLEKVLDELEVSSEVVFTNDGSTDGSLQILEELRNQDDRVAIVNLSRNFGKEIALTAGLDYATGEAAVVIDADLQDPPELMPEFIKHWRGGYDVVYGVRTSRLGESIVKRLTAFLFYRLMQMTGRVKIPMDTGDFRLLSRRAVESLKRLREQHRFMKGLFTWIGYRQKPIYYQRDGRYAGSTKWGYWKLFNLAAEGITSYTIAPLKFSTYMGLLSAAGAVMYSIVVISKTLMYGEPVRGYPTLLVVILFFGGVQLLALGIIGEYLGRIFNETKQRPLYFLEGYLPPRGKPSLPI